MDCLVKEDEFFNSIYDQIANKSSNDLSSHESELKSLKINSGKIEKKTENLLNRLSEDKSFNSSPGFRNRLDELENQKNMLSSLIADKKIKIEQIKNSKIDKKILKNILSEFSSIYSNISIDQKKRLNHLIFSEVVSYFKKNENDGIIEIKLRGDGKIDKKWSQIKNANCKPTVRTSDVFGSARAPKLRTFYPLKFQYLLAA